MTELWENLYQIRSKFNPTLLKMVSELHAAVGQYMMPIRMSILLVNDAGWNIFFHFKEPTIHDKLRCHTRRWNV